MFQKPKPPKLTASKTDLCDTIISSYKPVTHSTYNPVKVIRRTLSPIAGHQLLYAIRHEVCMPMYLFLYVCMCVLYVIEYEVYVSVCIQLYLCVPRIGDRVFMSYYLRVVWHSI